MQNILKLIPNHPFVFDLKCALGLHFQIFFSEPVVKLQVQKREGSWSYLKTYFREVKPPIMTGPSVRDLSTERESFTEILRLFEV